MLIEKLALTRLFEMKKRLKIFLGTLSKKYPDKNYQFDTDIIFDI